MRFQRIPRGCGMAVFAATLALLSPAYAAGSGSAYGPEVDPALAELAQAAQASFAEAQGQRQNAFWAEQEKLRGEAAEQRRAREEAARAEEAELEKSLAATLADRDSALRRAQAERASSFRAKLRNLDARFKRELRQYSGAQRARLAARHTKHKRALLAAFQARGKRLTKAHEDETARLASAYADAKAQRAEALKADLERHDAASAAMLQEREWAFAAAQAVKEAEHLSTAFPAIAFGPGISAARDAVGATLRHELELIDGQALTVRLGDIQRLADEPGISRLAADLPTEPTAEPARAAFSLPSLQSLFPVVVGAPEAWAKGYTGKGVGIAVLDSGVAPLADFTGRLTHAVVPGLAPAASDELGHGTFVSAVAAGVSPDGRYAGVAPGAEVVAVNISRGNTIYSSDVIKGLEWVLANRGPRNIRVVVLALTESLPSSYRTSTLDFAVEKLWQKGIAVVVSAGNSGPDTMQFAPANDPYVITVGSSDPKGTAAAADDVLASFSSYGKTLDGHPKPDLLAPGRHVVSALPKDSLLDMMAPDANHVAPGYVRMNGTSVSAPQVAGAAAILLQEDPSLTPDQLKWLLLTTSRPVSGSSANSLDVAAALAYQGEVGRANIGLALSVGPLRAGDDDGRKSEFNSGALREALSWEKVAGKLEGALRWESAAAAWDKAAELWLEKLDVGYKAAVDSDLGARAWTKAGKPENAAESWQRAGTAAEKVAAWQTAATYLGFGAEAWERKGHFGKAAAAWERASLAAVQATGIATASFENKAIAWIKAVSALESAVAAWTKHGDLQNAGAAEARRLALRELALRWANASWTNASWTNASWTNASWTNASWLNASWTNASWTNASWTNASWTNASWTSATWE